MIRACDLKKGDVVKISAVPHVLEDVNVQAPSARGSATLYKFRFRNVASKQKVDKVCRGDEVFDEADFEKRAVQYLYRDASGFTFMDMEDFSQFTLNEDDLGDQVQYLVDGLEGINSLCSDGKILAIELPPLVELEVVDTGPSMRNASATARSKPATLSTGMIVQVPEYLEKGTRIRVDTRTGAFASRA